MNCIFTKLDNGRWHCPVCSYTTKRAYDVAPNKNCGNSPYHISSNGPGTVLHSLLASLGAKPTSSCGCAAKIAEMNRGGVAWCREHRAMLVAWLADAYYGLTWGEVRGAVAAAAKSGLALRIYPWDVAGSLVDLAIERAEARAALYT